MVADPPRVAAILQRIAADVDELARARRVADLDAAAARPDRAGRTVAPGSEPDLDFCSSCPRGYTLGITVPFC